MLPEEASVHGVLIMHRLLHHMDTITHHTSNLTVIWQEEEGTRTRSTTHQDLITGLTTMYKAVLLMFKVGDHLGVPDHIQDSLEALLHRQYQLTK